MVASYEEKSYDSWLAARALGTRISGGHLISVGSKLATGCAIVQPPFCLSHCTSVRWHRCM